MEKVSLQRINEWLPIVKNEYVNGKKFFVRYNGKLCAARYHHTELYISGSEVLGCGGVYFRFVAEVATSEGIQMFKVLCGTSHDCYASIEDFRADKKMRYDDLVQGKLRPSLWLQELNNAFCNVYGERLGNVEVNGTECCILRYVWNETKLRAIATPIVCNKTLKYGKNGFEIDLNDFACNDFSKLYLNNGYCEKCNPITIVDFDDEQDDDYVPTIILHIVDVDIEIPKDKIERFKATIKNVEQMLKKC